MVCLWEKIGALNSLGDEVALCSQLDIPWGPNPTQSASQLAQSDLESSQYDRWHSSIGGWRFIAIGGEEAAVDAIRAQMGRKIGR